VTDQQRAELIQLTEDLNKIILSLAEMAHQLYALISKT
jgi:hypothetical protein